MKSRGSILAIPHLKVHCGRILSAPFRHVELPQKPIGQHGKVITNDNAVNEMADEASHRNRSHRSIRSGATFLQRSL
jgi:hypothetical protein